MTREIFKWYSTRPIFFGRPVCENIELDIWFSKLNFSSNLNQESRRWHQIISNYIQIHHFFLSQFEGAQPKPTVVDILQIILFWLIWVVVWQQVWRGQFYFVVRRVWLNFFRN